MWWKHVVLWENSSSSSSWSQDVELDLCKNAQILRLRGLGVIFTESKAVHLIHHLPSEFPYRLIFNTTSRSCDRYDLFEFPRSANISQSVKQHFGTDELTIFIELIIFDVFFYKFIFGWPQNAINGNDIIIQQNNMWPIFNKYCTWSKK